MTSAAVRFSLALLLVTTACSSRHRDLESDALRLVRQGDAGELAHARQELQQRLQERRRSADRGAEARTLEALAEVTDALGDRLEAISLYRAALAIEQSLDAGRASRIESSIALVLMEIDDLARARRFADDALEHAKVTGDRVARARALFAAANLDLGRNLPERARTELQEALGLFRAAGEDSWTGLVLESLADCADREGQTDEVRRFDDQGLALFRKIGDRRGEAIALQSLGYWYDQYPQDYVAGRRYAAEAAQLSRRNGDLVELATNLDALGFIERTQDRFEPAIQLHHEALELRRRVHSRRGEAETLFSLGTALRHSGRFDEAQQMLRASVSVLHELGDSAREGTVMWQLARAVQKSGHAPEATVIADEALHMRESLRSRIAVVNRRAYYTEQLRAYYDLSIGLRMQRAGEQHEPQLVEEALLISERARARSLLDTLALANVGAGDDPLARRQAEVQHRVETLEEQLEAVPNDAALAEQRLQIERAIDANLADYAALEDRRESEQPAVRALNHVEPPSVARVQASLDTDTVLLEYYVGSTSSGSLVWAITRDELVGVPLAAAPDDLEKAAREFQESLTARARNHDAAAIAEADARVERQTVELGRLLLGPVARQLAGKRRVVVIPDGALSYVPFDLLPDEHGAPLAIGRELFYVPSYTVLSALRALRTDTTPQRAGLVIFADPVFSAGDARMGLVTGAPGPQPGSSAIAATATASRTAPAQELAQTRSESDAPFLARLPYTQREAASIASLLPADQTSLHLGFAAQKQAILDGALKHYRWIHLATHGLIDSTHPDRSGLVFSRFDATGRPLDGDLRLREIYGLSLSADLVVLSACQTAIGRLVRRDGLISLTRGFLHAGARSVLATLWPVDDQATSRLMYEFYRALLGDHLPPALALARAKRVMHDDPRFHAPFYWAGFVLHGDWQAEPAGRQSPRRD